jgi:DNA-binding CsgD family transcriptional regulator
MSGVAQTADEMALAARNAVASGDWVTARTLFETLVECEATPAALAGLGDTLWWLGRTDDAVRYQEQAYAAFRRVGDAARSAMTAVGLYLLYRVSLGNVAAARGWLGRAARLVEEAGLAPLAGWVALLRAHDSDDAVAAERWSREACEGARGFGDPDLELCAISQLGASLMQQGELAEGTALLDEAMAASLAGECRRPHTVVYTSCNMISACAETAEFDHALQWIRAADGFMTRYGSPHLYVHCRVYYGVVLFASGDWAAAESELREAMAAGVSAEPALHAEASARFAELRLAQGRLEEAERLLEGLEDHTTSACVLAAIALAGGNPAAARRIALRRVRELDQRDSVRPGAHRDGLAVCLEAGRLWELLAEASAGREAAAAVEHLTALAQRTGCAHLEACGLRAAGILNRDVLCLERALSLFAGLRRPLEAGRTRMALAGLLDGDDAVAEARLALAAFEDLGAARDADRAAALLRELGVMATRGGPSGVGELSQREREVLDLLGEGLSNRELADRLFLSRKTVERHVRNVLFKLGLRNRAEAAAYVVRHRQRIRSTD